MNEEPKKPLAIISGGSGYIGGAIVDELERNGWQVAVLSRNENKNSRLSVYKCDITEEKQIEKTISSIVSTLGPIHACIHAAAAPLYRKALLDTPLDSFTESIETAVRGGFLLAKSVMPRMADGACFVGITTEALDAQRSGTMGAYLCAKYSLRGLLRVLASELSNKGIRVYAVAPGFLPGGLNNDLPEAVMEFLIKKNDRMQSPKDVALLIGEMCVNPDIFPSGSSITVKPRVISPL